jgi:hypothetical protein
MSGRQVMTALVMGGVLLAAGSAHAVSTGCAKIVAALDDHPGLSAEEVAKKTSTDIETVRGCDDEWRASMKDAKGPKAPAASAMAPGCAKIVAAFDRNPGLSADEVAKKTSTDVETVRNCMKARR